MLSMFVGLKLSNNAETTCTCVYMYYSTEIGGTVEPLL